MTPQEVVDKLRLLKQDYVQRSLGLNPAMLPAHLAEFLGYFDIVSSHYAEAQKAYYDKQGLVIQEELLAMIEVNATATNRDEKRTASEKDDRITIRMRKLKSQREWLKEERDSCQVHINTIQSLLKRYGDEAKGIM